MYLLYGQYTVVYLVPMYYGHCVDSLQYSQTVITGSWIQDMDVECDKLSSGSRGGSMGKSSFDKKFMRKHSTYSTLTLELRTSASTVAIMHVCVSRIRHTYGVAIYVHVNTTRSTWNHRNNERIKAYSCIAPSAAKDGDMLSVWERLFFRALCG